jgi:ferredoxin
VYKIRLNKQGKEFDAEADEIILDAADRAGIAIAYSCRSGTCRACITRVLSGCIEHEAEFADSLSIDRHELADGYRLLCSSLACSDAVLDR